MWIFILFELLCINLGASVALAATHITATEGDEGSFWYSIRKKIRSQYFTEIMSPSLGGNSAYVPLKDGSKFFPTNAFGFLWVDYEIASGFKLLYFQRGMITYAPSPQTNSGTLNFISRDPRFGIRKIQIWDISNLMTQYDFYIHPAWSDLSRLAHRKFELGMRTTHIYQFPGSRWKTGGFTEISASFYKPGGKGSDLYGFFAPFLSYKLNPLFSTQHWLIMPFRHLKNTAWRELEWDSPTPYVQNGVSIDINQKIWASFFINNYLSALPTIRNTWASLWLNFEFL